MSNKLTEKQGWCRTEANGCLCYYKRTSKPRQVNLDKSKHTPRYGQPWKAE